MRAEDIEEIGQAYQRGQGTFLSDRPHGLTATHPDEVNADLLNFLGPLSKLAG
jgi:hypothetical protein